MVEFDGRLVIKSEMVKHDVATGVEECLYLVVRRLAQLECDGHIIEFDVSLEVDQTLLLVLSYVCHEHDLVVVVSEQTVQIHLIIV